VKNLLGRRDLSMNEAAKIFGEKIGKPDLKYVQVSYADMHKPAFQAEQFQQRMLMRSSLSFP